MVSIIVCSTNSVLFTYFQQNVADTIGVPFEIIKVNKPSSICSGYNTGAAGAKYSHLCFVHEDVKFLTQNWGLKLIDHFNAAPLTGLLGVAGNVYRKKMPSTWPQAYLKNITTHRINIIQNFKYRKKETHHVLVNPLHEKKSRVVNLDGVFLATKKEIFKANNFDERLLKGFHGYDLDLCMQIGQNYEIYVVFDILIEHFSEGKCDCGCLCDYITLSKKWEANLPVIAPGFTVDKIFDYNESWKQINRHVKFFIMNGKGFPFSLKKFFILTSFVDRKAFSILTYYKFLLKGLFYFIKTYYRYKQQPKSNA